MTYTGILPDLFREGQGIVATGVLTSATEITAQEVLAKHDEEYMPPELAEKMKGIKHEKPANMPVTDASSSYQYEASSELASETASGTGSEPSSKPILKSKPGGQ